jgi:hypothetical protein
MPENPLDSQPSEVSTSADFFTSPASLLRQEYDEQQALFQVQPPLVQRFLEAQARTLADAAIRNLPQVRFSLPDRVIIEVKPTGDARPHTIPPDFREQLAGGLVERLTGTDVRTILRQRLAELIQSKNSAVAAGASLILHATVMYMVHNMLPAGRTVSYTAPEDEEIPTIPAAGGLEPESAITATTDAIAEESRREVGRGELQVPFVPAARRFYLPQWVAFDQQGKLLVNTPNEAEAHIASMQRFVSVLHAAVGLASYMVADEEYQQKRYGMLGQLINQGRALARYETDEIIRTIMHRASAHDLNRGLSLSLPYFDDQTLEMKTHDFTVIPAGRIMFVPAFVVRAAKEEQAKIAQHTRLSPSTRKYLLAELKALEDAFEESD